VTPRAAAPQSYRDFGAYSWTQYQAPPQSRYGQSPPPFAPRGYQATLNTYHPPEPSQSRYDQSPPLAPQRYQATLDTYHPPGPSQPPPSPPHPHRNYAHNKQYPQPAYPTHPPKEQPKAYKPDYYGASICSAPPTPAQSGPHPAYHAYHHARSSSLNGPVNCAPLDMGLDDSAYRSEPIDDVTSLLSRTHLDNRPTATTALRRLNLSTRIRSLLPRLSYLPVDSVIESVVESVINSVTYSLFPLPPPTLLLFPFLHLSLCIYRGLRTTFQ